MSRQLEDVDDSNSESSMSSRSSSEAEDHGKVFVKFLELMSKNPDSMASFLKSSSKKKKKKKKQKKYSRDDHSHSEIILKKKRFECSDSFSSDASDKRSRLAHGGYQYGNASEGRSSAWGRGFATVAHDTNNAHRKECIKGGWGWGSSNIGQGEGHSSNIGQGDGHLDKKSGGGGFSSKGQSNCGFSGSNVDRREENRVSGWGSSGMPNIGQSSSNMGNTGNVFGRSSDSYGNFGPDRVDNRKGFGSSFGNSDNHYREDSIGRDHSQRPPYNMSRSVYPDRGTGYRNFNRNAQSRINMHSFQGNRNQYHGRREFSPRMKHSNNRDGCDTYWICLKARSNIRQVIKLNIGKKSIPVSNPSQYSRYLTVTSDNFVLNPLYSENILDSIVSYIWRFEINGHLQVPSMLDVMSFLRELYEQMVHYISFRALVNKIREMCYRLKYRICERRDVPSGTTVDDRNWYKQVVFGYDYNKYYHVNMKNVLAETAKLEYQTVMYQPLFRSIVRRDNLVFTRGTIQESGIRAVANPPRSNIQIGSPEVKIATNSVGTGDGKVKITASENILGGQKKKRMSVWQ